MPVLPSKNAVPPKDSPTHIEHLCRRSAEARVQGKSREALRLALEAASKLKNIPTDTNNPTEHSLLRCATNIESALVNTENFAEYADALRYALEALRAGKDYATQTGDHHWRSFVLNILGDILVRAGKPHEGLHYCVLALPMRLAEGDEVSLCWSLMNCAKAYMALGNTEHAMEYAQAAQKYCLSDAMTYPATATSTLLATLHLLRNEYPSALEALAHAEALARGQKYLHRLPEILAYKAAIMRHRGELADALQALDEAEIIAAEGELRAVLVEVYRERALVLADMHKSADAALVRERAVALEQRCTGSEVQHAITRLLEGKTLANLHENKHHNSRILKQAPISSPSEPAPKSLLTAAPVLVHELLTPTEWHIASLLADSWTNAEIAQALYISKRTVEQHRANILAKLKTYYALPRASNRIMTRFVRSFG